MYGASGAGGPAAVRRRAAGGALTRDVGAPRRVRLQHRYVRGHRHLATLVGYRPRHANISDTELWALPILSNDKDPGQAGVRCSSRAVVMRSLEQSGATSVVPFSRDAARGVGRGWGGGRGAGAHAAHPAGYPQAVGVRRRAPEGRAHL